MTCTPARAFALALLLAVATLIFAPPAAHAHPADDWYGPYRWAPETVHEYSYQESWPAGLHRDVATAGADEWNVNGHELTPQFHPTLPDSTFTQSTNACTNPNSAVYWQDDGSGYLGVTRRCVAGGEMVQFIVVINTFYNWYVGFGDPGTGEYDLMSTVAHEFGHVTGGWGWETHHWHDGPNADPSLCTHLNSDRQTMCAGQIGTDWRRFIGVHDVHTFQNAYLPAPPPCEVDYVISGTWPGNVQVDLTVHNTTTSWINGWTAEWAFTGDESVYNQWGVAVTQTGPAATATGDGFGAQIAPGNSVTVGFQATVSGTPTVPAAITCEA